jgi:ABC-type transport system involved in multi-copper enzyme maturation permease subunit
VDWFNAGNLISIAIDLAAGVMTGTALSALMFPALRLYLIFHGVIAIICTTWAVARLRFCVLESTDSESAGRRGQDTALRLGLTYPVLHAWPMGWKELVAVGKARRHWLGWLLRGLGVAVLLYPALHFLDWFGAFFSGGSWKATAAPMNLWIRAVGAFVGCFMLIQVGVQAAGSITGERGRGTLDGLLTTPLTPRGILIAKWLGSIAGPRWGWLVLGGAAALAIATGGLSPIAVPGWIAVWLVYAGFMAMLGLYFSALFETTQRATLATVIAAVVLLAMTIVFSYDFAIQGVVPPTTLFLLPFFDGDVQRAWSVEAGFLVSHHLAGLTLVAFGGIILWFLAITRFLLVIGRNKRLMPLEQNQATSPASLVDSFPAAATAATSASASPAPLKRIARLPPGPWRRPLVQLISGFARRWLKPVAIMSLPVAIMFVAALFHSYSSERTLHEALAETDLAEPGWRMEDMIKNQKQVPRAQSAAVQAQRALASQPPGFWPGQDFAAAFGTLPDPVIQLNRAQCRTLAVVLQKKEKFLLEARRLEHYPEGTLPLAWEPTTPFLAQSSVWPTRAVADILGQDMLLLIQEADFQRACRSCVAFVNVERAIGDFPSFFAQHLRAELQELAVARAERMLAQGEPDPAALEQLQHVLEKEAAEPLEVYASRGVMADVDNLLQRIQEGDRGANRILLAVDQSGGGIMAFKIALWIFLDSSLPRQRAQVLRLNKATVAGTRNPTWQRFTTISPPPAPPAGSLSRLILLGMPGGPRADAFVTRLASLNSASVMLAAERFRRDKGFWPAALPELVPQYLAAIPPDPYNGKPLRYRRIKDGVVIYSVGPNMTDDGGDIRSKTLMAPRPLDIGVQLWDPEKRRQPALDRGPPEP